MVHKRLRLIHAGWLWVLISGLVLFLATEKVLKATENPNFIPTVILLGAFLVPVTLVTYVYEREPVKDVPLPTIAVSFFWGGVVGVIVAGLLEYSTLRELGFMRMLGVGLIEESAKLVFPVAVYVRGRYRSEAHGLLFGISSGMGFAALETMGYGFVSLIRSGGDIGILEETLFFRGLLSPAGHAAWTGMVCAVLWRERQRLGHWVVNGAVLGAFALAVLLHALWDTFASFTGPTLIDVIGIELLSLGVALFSLTLLIRRLREAARVSPT
jgi:RsiW-degrading membrane proteinase PrsW (M82 family)